MAFTPVAPGDDIRAAHVTELQNALTGAPNPSTPAFSFTQWSSPTVPTVTLRNPGGGPSLHAYKADGVTDVFRLDEAGAQVGALGLGFIGDPNTFLSNPIPDAIGIVTGGVERARFSSAGLTGLAALALSGALTAPSLAIDTNVLVADPTNNRVGVNDAAPDFALDLAGGHLRIQGANELRFGGTGAGDADVALFRSAADTLETNDALVVNGLARAAGGLRIGAGAARLTVSAYGETTWDPPSVTENEQTETTLTVTGAALGDFVLVSLSTFTQSDATLSGRVSAADTVRVCLLNLSGVALNVASGTLRAWTVRAAAS